jgi:glyoxylase-like metal-dependent hydrolase (beta-lactamase superfamily II)
MHSARFPGPVPRIMVTPQIRKGRKNVKYLVALSAALLASAASVQFAAAKDSPADLVKAAVTAEGGIDALKSLKGLALKGTAKHWEPGQSYKADGEPRFLGDTAFTATVDLGSGAARLDLDRAMKYPAVEQLKYTEVVTPTLGFVTNEKGSTAASGVRLASQLRELERASPTLLLKAMDDAKNLSPADNQKLGKASLPAVNFADGATKFTIMFDPKTHLPAAIRTRDDDNISGDSNYDLVFSDWKPVNGVQMAHTLTYNLNDVTVGKVSYSDVAANPPIPADAFTPSDAVKSAAKGPATGDVPYQWVLRRIALGRYVDADTLFYAPNAPPKLVELGPDVVQVVTGSHNNLIVNMKDGLAIFDAPMGEAQSKFVIDAAKQKFPGKAIKYLILTHHHMDHTGGMRTFAAEGATIVVPAPDKAYFEKDLKAAHTVVPDAYSKNPKKVQVVEVKDQMSLKDADGSEIKLTRIDNPHVDGMLLGYVVKDNVVWVTDLYSPVRDTAKTAGTEAVAAAVKKLGITGATFAGGHGASGPQSAMDAIVAQK